MLSIGGSPFLHPAEPGIASAAIAHPGLALPQINWDVSVTSPYLASDVVKTPVAVVEGHVTMPDRPGLGIEVDETLLSKFRYRAGRRGRSAPFFDLLKPDPAQRLALSGISLARPKSTAFRP